MDGREVEPEIDADGYPNDALLDLVRAWDWKQGWEPLMDMLQGHWWAGEMLFTGPVMRKDGAKRWRVSTGGWSGNEDLLSAMRGNYLFWSSCFLSQYRGGHFRFEVRPREAIDAAMSADPNAPSNCPAQSK